MPIINLGNFLRSGKKDLHEHIDETLAIIVQKEPIIQALLPEYNRSKRLHQTVDKLYARYPDAESRPPLFGVLFGVKDLFNVDDMPTLAGSKLPPEAFRGEEAKLVTQLKNLGAIVLGKTVSTEFAYFSPGPTCNPINPEHTPGGSSSGSAAAVAAGYCPFALGTQTIASIIRPASYCGVYGLKPSYGLLSTDGVFPFSQTADHAGLIADSLETIEYLYSLLVKPQPNDLTHSQPVIGAVQGAYLEQASDELQQHYARTLSYLHAQGFQVQSIDIFPDIESINEMHRRLIATEFAHNHRLLYEQYGSLYSEHSRQLYLQGIEVSRFELEALRGECIMLRENIMRTMSDLQISFWLAPSTTSTAPKGLISTGSPLMSLPWTNAGLPSLTIPFGKDTHELPIGLQLVGAWQSDAQLIRMGKVLNELKV